MGSLNLLLCHEQVKALEGGGTGINIITRSQARQEGVSPLCQLTIAEWVPRQLGGELVDQCFPTILQPSFPDKEKLLDYTKVELNRIYILIARWVSLLYVQILYVCTIVCIKPITKLYCICQYSLDSNCGIVWFMLYHWILCNYIYTILHQHSFIP